MSVPQRVLTHSQLPAGAPRGRPGAKAEIAALQGDTHGPRSKCRLRCKNLALINSGLLAAEALRRAGAQNAALRQELQVSRRRYRDKDSLSLLKHLLKGEGSAAE